MVVLYCALCRQKVRVMICTNHASRSYRERSHHMKAYSGDGLGIFQRKKDINEALEKLGMVTLNKLPEGYAIKGNFVYACRKTHGAAWAGVVGKVAKRPSFDCSKLHEINDAIRLAGEEALRGNLVLFHRGSGTIQVVEINRA